MPEHALQKRLEYGGLALFVMLYAYMWFKNYQDRVANSTRIAQGRDLTRIDGKALLWYAFFGWEVVGAGLIIFLILLALIVTAFRALSLMSLNRKVDSFALRLTFGWLHSAKLFYALVQGCVLSTVLVLLVLLLGAHSRKPRQAPQRPARSASYWVSLLRYIGYQFRRLTFWLANAFLPPSRISDGEHYSAIIATILLLNLLIVSAAVLMTYSGVQGEPTKPATLTTTKPTKPTKLMQAPSRASFGLDDYRKLLKKAREEATANANATATAVTS